MIDITEKTFGNIGGSFVTPAPQIALKLKNIKAFVFDWDGVYNDATKSSGHPNGFSEADSMGINLLRYDYYFRTGQLPVSAIITGQENPTALDFARRESFSAIYFNIKNKNEAFKHFCANHQLKPENIAWFFDDILDLGIAKECGLRFYLGRNSQPLTTQFVIANNMADYISANSGGQHALRECCELAMGLNGNFDQLLNNRLSFNDNYAEYFTNRNAIKPVVFTKKESGIEEVK
jgi:3-deoxy-D-manno-octulosonate 8-phosphate phosphatase (KDO 8-P phosphatase)